jgi:hypothetical protein
MARSGLRFRCRFLGCGLPNGGPTVGTTSTCSVAYPVHFVQIGKKRVRNSCTI